MPYTKEVEQLPESFLPAEVSPVGISDLINNPRCERLQSKKLKVPHLRCVMKGFKVVYLLRAG
jgi:hypothetical protein